ncbi:hypothetical protein ATO2_01360 [Roseovarius sp. 22II1-1F6A]|nr:hypothetical protein ATO2_01360 [Roseovarius sp. 22II1-1F6A]
MIRPFTAPLAKIVAALCALTILAACGAAPMEPGVSRELRDMYPTMEDNGWTIPAVPAQYLNDDVKRQIVTYRNDRTPGTIIVDPYSRHLFYIIDGTTAKRYTVGVGKAGRGFAGRGIINHQKDWPSWTPTQRMLKTDPELYGPVAGGMEGGLDNPLGARALYLYRNGRDTLYRIHGTPYPWTVGGMDSAGCIRLFQQDIIDLAKITDNGTQVIVLSEAQSAEDQINRGPIGDGV